MPKDFPQSKLAALVSGLSGKEAALLHINYLLDEEKNSVSYTNETETISSTVERTFLSEQRHDYIAYYNLFINTGLFSLDLQTLRLQLSITNSNLAHLRSVILWSCDSYRNLLLINGGFGDKRAGVGKGWPLEVVRRNLGNAQLVKRRNHKIVFKNDTTPIYSELVKDGKATIGDMISHQEVIKRIEQKYFENKVAVCDMQFTQAKSAVETFEKHVTNVIKDIEIYYNLFHMGRETEFTEGKEISTMIVNQAVDEKWVEERIKLLLDKSGFKLT